MSILLALVSFSSAFSPNNAPFIGIEPVLHRTVTAHRQHQLRQSPAWQAFVAEHPTWQARFDQHTGRPYRAWGAGLSFSLRGTDAELESHLRDWLTLWPQLTGLKGTELQLRDLALNETKDGNNWLVFFEQVQPLPVPVENDLAADQTARWVEKAVVYRSGISLRLAEVDTHTANLTQLGISTQPALHSGGLEIHYSASAAAAVAIEEGPASQAAHRELSARLVVLPLGEGQTRRQHLCWEIRSKTSAPVGHWVSFVDAQTAEVLNVHNEVRFFEGSLHALHDSRNPGTELIESPLYRLRVDPTDSDNITEADGSYLLLEEPAEPIVAVLESQYTEVVNSNGDGASLVLSAGDQLWQESSDAESTATLAELDQYVFQTHITNWALQYAPQITNQWRVNVNVNINDYCNAYFDGTLNFFVEGRGCNNTGRIADVSYHEWGHGFHYYNLLSGEYDGAMSEGISDSISFFQTEDNIMAPHFSTNGNGIRDVAPNRVYPDDLVEEVHADGLIFAGTVWDLWNSEKELRGEEAAYEFLVPLFIEALRAGPTLPTSYDEFVFANDDNGDLSDGTPDLCSIVDAFGQHGLGPGGGSGFFQVTMPALSAVGNLVGSSINVEAMIEVFAEQCAEGQLDSVHLNTRSLGMTEWRRTELSLQDGVILGELESDSEGVLEYHLEWTDTLGNNGTLPKESWINPFQIYVGDLDEIYCTDFESDDAGFTHELVTGQAQEGADDWMWGMPLGLGGDPDYAASGDYVWGNDLGGEINGSQYNGEYQNDKHNRLSTPAFNVEGYDQVVLSFDRWLNVEDGHYDQAQVLANGETVWSNHATNQNNGGEHHRDRQWMPQTVLVDTNGDAELSFAWDIISDRGLSMGGWTIDNVCVYGVVQELEADDEESIKGGCACDSGASELTSNGLGHLLLSGWLCALLLFRRQD